MVILLYGGNPPNSREFFEMTYSLILRREPRRLFIPMKPEWFRPATQAELARRNNHVRNAFRHFGFKAAFLLPWFEAVNFSRQVRNALHANSPKPVPISSLHRREWIGLGIVLSSALISAEISAHMHTRSALPKALHATTAPAARAYVPSVIVRPAVHGNVELGPAVPKLVDFGPLAGRNMGKDLNALYSGVEGIAPKFAKVDFSANLARLYTRKLGIKNVSPATLKEVPRILARYNERQTLTDLPTYASDIQKRIDAANASMDWNGLCTRLGVNRDHANGCDLLIEQAKRSTATQALAYSMSEIMANSKDGRFNALFYDILLKNAGLEYIGSLPAVHDTYLSLGGWQFTSLAVFRTRADGKDALSASIVSMFAPKDLRIPWSTARLVRGDHDLAAKYFGDFNVANLVGCPKVLRAGKWTPDCANAKQRAVFRKLLATSSGMDQVAIYKAVAHHNPTYARIYTRKWLAAGAPGKLSDHLGPALTLYARKTEVNLAGISWFLNHVNQKKGIAS